MKVNRRLIINTNKIKLIRALFIYLSALMLTPVQAQGDIAKLRISYEATFKSAQERPAKHDDMVLLVGGQSSKFYSITADRQQHILDSIQQTSGGDLSQLLAATGRFRAASSFGQKYVVLKHWPTDGMLTYTTKLLDCGFKYEEPMPTLDWQLQECDTIIAEHTCYKAIAQHRGHTWTAWYAPDITVSDGPWKLCGLPGLILQAMTEDGNFSFVCTSILHGQGAGITADTKGCKSTKPTELQRLVVLEVTDPGQLTARAKGMDMQQMEVRRTGKKQKLTPILIEDYSR